MDSPTSMIANALGSDSDDDGQVDIEIMQLSGDVLHTIENFHGDASLGSFKARLKQAKIDFSLWRFIVVGPESFDMANDYCKFMLTKAVKQAMVHPGKGERKKLQLMVVYCGKRQSCAPPLEFTRVRVGFWKCFCT